MRRSLLALTLGVSFTGAFVMAQKPSHFNPMIDLLAAGKPVFGLYAPANPRGGGGGRNGGGSAIVGTAVMPPTPTPTPTAPPTPPKTLAELAKDALAVTKSDFTFNGNMEGSLDGRPAPAGAPTPATPPMSPYASFVEYAQGLLAGGWLVEKPYKHLSMPTAVKTPNISDNPTKAIENIGRQLNAGVTTVVFVEVDNAEELKQGLAAMRFKSKGGTRPDDVGMAPKLWGMSDKDYKEKADVWPLNPKGELVNWTIIETKEGLAHVDEIAAVKGIGSLVVGWGTLGGVFRGDPEGRENAAQQVLAACKKYKLACGFPAGEGDIEARMKQGFSLFIISWGDAGLRAIDIGRKVGGR